MTTINRKWPPDWRNAADYPFTDDTTPEEWAWEFLRRNKDYQQEHANFLQRTHSFCSSREDLKPFWRKSFSEFCSLMDSNFTTPLAAIDLDDEVKKIWTPISEKFGVYSLGGLPSPSKCYQDNRLIFLVRRETRAYSSSAKMMLSHKSFLSPNNDRVFYQTDNKTTILCNKEERVSIFKKPSELTISIDLFGDIKEQTRQIRKVISAARQQMEKTIGLKLGKNRQHWDIMVEMLQCFDGKANRATTKEIATAVFPKTCQERTVRKRIETAQSYINGGYLSIIDRQSERL